MHITRRGRLQTPRVFMGRRQRKRRRKRRQGCCLGSTFLSQSRWRLPTSPHLTLSFTRFVVTPLIVAFIFWLRFVSLFRPCRIFLVCDVKTAAGLPSSVNKACHGVMHNAEKVVEECGRRRERKDSDSPKHRNVAYLSIFVSSPLPEKLRRLSHWNGTGPRHLSSPLLGRFAKAMMKKVKRLSHVRPP